MMASSKLPVAPLPPRWPPSASGQRGGAFGLRPWRPRVGSVLKHRALTAAVIDSRDYLAARRRAETELRIPPGTRIAFTGGMDCNDHLDRRALRRGDAKSRKARSLIGKNRPAG
jgi:hypothetical protein